MSNKIADALTLLRPDGGWITQGEEFDGIQFISCEPVTEKELEDAKKNVEAAVKKAEADKVSAKASAQAKLTALGLTEEEVASILG
jgi:hypothetical protein